VSPDVILVPVESLCTSLAALRGGRKPLGAHAELSELPLRVVATDGDAFEVLDGFKRLSRWRALGMERVPVVVERPRSSAEAKAALLLSNRPPRTLTPMDEARVVFALRHEDKLGPAAIAEVCSRKRRWVFTRLTLAEQLAFEVAKRVDAGQVGVTLAHALCAFKFEEQEALCAAAERHRLKLKEALALLSAYRVAEDDAERRRLLADPLATVRPDQRSASPLSALGARIEERLDRVQEALGVLADFSLPDEGLTPAERRRLLARHRGMTHQLFTTARELAEEHLGFSPQEVEDGEETTHQQVEEGTTARAQAQAKEAGRGDRGAARGDQAAQGDEVRHKEDRDQAGPGPQGGPSSARGVGTDRAGRAVVRRVTNNNDEGEQARPLQGAHPGKGQEEPDQQPHPAGDHRAGLHRGPHDPDRLRTLDQQGASAQKEGLAPLRDSSG